MTVESGFALTLNIADEGLYPLRVVKFSRFC
jgi:hypothetical protein